MPPIPALAPVLSPLRSSTFELSLLPLSFIQLLFLVCHKGSVTFVLRSWLQRYIFFLKEKGFNAKKYTEGTVPFVYLMVAKSCFGGVLTFLFR